METILPLLFAGVVGFTHAFEPDHLVAVSSLVTRRQTLLASLKDGIFWGLGHTSTILAVGIMMILLKFTIAEKTFEYLEACVGAMLIALGVQRFLKLYQQEERHAQAHLHHQAHDHRMAYGVGLVHGLAGSGALVLLVMSQLKNSLHEIIYLLIFGMGSIVGMLLASGLFSLPFSKKLHRYGRWQWRLTVFSALLCVLLGIKILWQNLFSA